MTGRRLLTAISMLLFPWTVLVVAAGSAWGIELVYGWGLLNVDPLHVVLITTYLFEYTSGLPEYLLSWPISAVLYVLAVASITGSVAIGREDRRITAGLLVIAGLSHLRFALGVGARGGRIAVPVATVLFWLLAWQNRPDTIVR